MPLKQFMEISMNDKKLAIILICLCMGIIAFAFFYDDKNVKCEKQTIGGVFEIGEICRK